MATKAPISCHVLDTTTGRPAPNISVLLTAEQPASSTLTFTSTTDADGRISSWDCATGQTVGQVLDEVSIEGFSIWKLTFNTGEYYGYTNTFWPLVDLTFRVKIGEHHHVPLLLGPYSYTTYRGS